MKNSKEEIWRDIPGFENYQASSLGRIKSLDRWVTYSDGRERFFKGRILKGSISKGYMYVDFSKNGKRERFRIHQLVTVCFLNHTPDGHTLVVDHINGVKTDNSVENLQIVSQRQNLSTCYRANEDLFSSKLVGVDYYKRTNKWRAKIYYNEIQIHLGYYNNEEKASNAYQKALAKLENGTFNPDEYKPKWTSNFKGVYFNKNKQKWVANPYINGKQVYLGIYTTELEAYQAILEYEAIQLIKNK